MQIRTAALLELSVRVNGWARNVRLHRNALWPVEGLEVGYHDSPSNQGAVRAEMGGPASAAKGEDGSSGIGRGSRNATSVRVCAFFFLRGAVPLSVLVAPCSIQPS